MRFAGHEDVAAYLSGPDLGRLGQESAVRDAKINITGLETEALVGGAGMEEYAATAGHGAITDAKGSYYAAQQQASNMAQGGSMLGNAIGGLGSLFGGGGGGGGGGGFATNFSGLGGYSSGLDWASNSQRSYFNNGY